MIAENQPYFSLMIPSVPSDKHPGELHEKRTPWHPTALTGKWSVLSRGAFATVTEAIDWAREHLNGLPYSIVRVDAEGSIWNLNGTPCADWQMVRALARRVCYGQHRAR